MITIAHAAGAVPLAAVAALGISLAGGLVLRGRRARWVPVIGAAAVLAGFMLLLPAVRLERAWLTPRPGPEMLLLPALVAGAGAALVAWRGRPSRWLSVAVAGVAGWWLARTSTGLGDYWRVLFGVAALTWMVARGAANQAWRGFASASVLWGGLVVAGSALTGSALVVAAATAGLRVAIVPPAIVAVVPAAIVAVVIGAAELSGGRLLRGRLDAVDLACLAALVAPWIAGWIERRLGRAGRFGPAIAACMASAVAIGLVWFLRRALFT